MDLLVSKKTLDRLAKANGLQLYRQILRSNNEAVLSKALDFIVAGRIGCG